MQHRCPICGDESAVLWAEAKDIEYFTSDASYRYWLCPACQALFLSPLPAGGLAAIYPPNYYSYDAGHGGLWKVKAKLDAWRLRKTLARLKGPELRALDIGGGSGAMLDLARRADPRIRESWVVDIDGGAKSRAEAKGHRFFMGPFETYRDDRPFDVIFALNVIEHVADPAEFLRHCARLLAPGGLLMIQTPNFDSLDARVFRHQSWAGLHCPRHWVLLSERSVKRMAADAHLEIERLGYTQGAPFWAKSVLAMLWRIKLVKLDRARPADGHPLLPLLLAAFAALDFLRLPFSKTSQFIITMSPKPGAPVDK